MSRTIKRTVGLLLLPFAVAACVADDATSTGLDETGGSTLPSITTAATAATESTTDEPTSDSSAEQSAENDAASPATTTGTTTTTAPLDSLLGLNAELLADGFDQPVHVAAVPGTDHLVVVEREGMVKSVDLITGEVSEQPFLDLTDPATLLSSSIEQGLLGLAFDPTFEATGRFYAYWTNAEGDTVLGRFVTAGPPSPLPPADPTSMEILLTIDQPAERHNAGHLEFGPDGLLYVAVGDGGSGGEPAQDTTNPLGTILRLDVSATEAGYALPDGNPFNSEIWVYGLRNPWRFAIDPAEQLVYIGDVGQDSFEEINVVGLDGAGTDFGWREMEGDRCFRSSCTTAGRTIPVLQVEHEQGCSVTGGRVYRGSAIPEFTGHYFFGDWCKSFVRSFRLDGDPETGSVVDQLDHGDDLADVGQVTSFGTDHNGELLTVNWAGQLHRIIPRR